MVAFWVFASVLSAVTVAGQNLFGQNFIGDGTFYGNQGDQSSGNCAFGVTGAATLPWTTGLTGPKFLALASPLYNLGPSTNCGLCVAYYGDPVDAGCTTCGTSHIPQTVTYAMISNQCPEVRVTRRVETTFPSCLSTDSILSTLYTPHVSCTSSPTCTLGPPS